MLNFGGGKKKQMKRNRMAHRTGGRVGVRGDATVQSPASALPPHGTSAAVKETYSYLRPYLQRMEQPVRKRRNQKFSVSELDFTRLYGEKI